MNNFTVHISPHVNAEIRLAMSAEAHGHFDTAMRHLERAHVLGQRSTYHHVRVHWLMLQMSVRNRGSSEAAGQMWRAVAAAIFTPLGLLPKGNPGAARMSGLRPTAIPKDLQVLIDLAK